MSENNNTKLIPLTQGQFAIVDAEDFDELNKFKWCATKEHGTWYAVRFSLSINGKRHKILMHRVILGLEPGDGKEGDHQNHNGLDNRLDNLRICTRSQNQHNQKPQKNCTSQYKGVTWHKRAHKWQVEITKNGKKRYLGCFMSEIEAALSYNKYAQKFYGEFARLNILSK